MKKTRKLHYAMKAFRKLNKELCEAADIIADMDIKTMKRDKLYRLAMHLAKGYELQADNVKEVNNAIANDNEKALSDLLDDEPQTKNKVSFEVKEISADDVPKEVKDLIDNIKKTKKREQKDSSLDSLVAELEKSSAHLSESDKDMLRDDMKRVLDAISKNS